MQYNNARFLRQASYALCSNKNFWSATVLIFNLVFFNGSYVSQHQILLNCANFPRVVALVIPVLVTFCHITKYLLVYLRFFRHILLLHTSQISLVWM